MAKKKHQQPSSFALFMAKAAPTSARPEPQVFLAALVKPPVLKANSQKQVDMGAITRMALKSGFYASLSELMTAAAAGLGERRMPKAQLHNVLTGTSQIDEGAKLAIVAVLRDRHKPALTAS